MLLIVMIVLILMVAGAYPSWPYSLRWGYYPSGVLGFALLLVLLALALGYR